MRIEHLVRITRDVEDWDDGWRLDVNPEYQWRRAVLSRDMDEYISVEIEVCSIGGEHFVFAGCWVQGKEGRRQPVSVSVRNPVIRKAIDYINQQLDAFEQEPRSGLDDH